MRQKTANSIEPHKAQANSKHGWSLSKAVRRRAEAGDLKGATQLIEEGCPIMEQTEELAATMRLKHPPRLITTLETPEKNRHGPTYC